MDFVRLGRTGLKVSRICLGCMTFGEPARGNHPWTLDGQASRPIIRHAWEAGINFFDTANTYSDGTSEEIVGAALRELAPRDELVIATKVFNRMKPGPNGAGLSRKAILHEVDQSLKRLGTDYVNLYQIHRWDHATPIEETLEALHDVVKAGKARYIGASSMFAWQFAKALHQSERRQLTRFVSMQNHLNLLYREEEREMLPLCRDEGIGVIPWSPLARGRLARPWGEDTPRIGTDEFGRTLYAKTQEADRAVVEAVAQVAARRGVPMAQVALAWVAGKPGVTAPIVGASKLQHIDDAVAALQLTLTSDEVAALEAPYVPHAIAGQR
ncbi:MAG TPA: aldo/keto reductase [Ideonella sp.]|nr:aldo/keto reductase [Ideonella sp.]